MSASATAAISVLDAGGQYCHLIARKIRELGVEAEVRASDTPANEFAGRHGIVISGGPASVYDADSPSIDPAILSAGIPVLGICYGLQLIAHHCGGTVQKGERGEFGLAELRTLEDSALLAGTPPGQQVWMSHRDLVTAMPEGFRRVAETASCPYSAIADPARRLYGVQFHPEVVHTPHGQRILSNFVLDICRAPRDWDPVHSIEALEEQIRRSVGDRNVFFFVSGGVDSTVAYTLCLRALGAERVRGVYVDTGLMREGETDFVRHTFDSLHAEGTLAIEMACEEFLGALQGASDPEQKRHIIGEQFVALQERIIETRHLLDGHWVLGQGTIYPDTIESGGTAKAATIKTHHNRVAGIQKLLEEGRVVEPLAQFYKDEVRAIGRQLNVPDTLLERHPFPGPGLAIRCLCVESGASMVRDADGWVVPVNSVGVQGDSRSYKPVLILTAGGPREATEVINRRHDVNRVTACLGGNAPVDALSVRPSGLTAARLATLRRADAIVRRLSHQSGFETRVWQFPVILIPLGTADAPDSVVLRPVHSVDGMTAEAVVLPDSLRAAMAAELLAVRGVAAVLLDLTHKPPGTIEWE
ncbi:MAG: glutamine-hydrolyzing GMP synthase [Bryobacterales bacterium]|nr:glutamine-hydrolyzing GMP synthase [Bryobacterales bacterium]